MNSKNTLAFLGALIIAFAAGFFVGKRLLLSQNNQEVAKLQSQIEQAKKFYPPQPSAMHSISGTIKSVSGTTITLDASLPNPFADMPTIRTVRIMSATAITMFKQKDSETFRKEYVEFEKKTATQPAGPTSGYQLVPPNPFYKTTGAVADLKEGQSVTITAKEDIATKESFDAASVEVTIVMPKLATQQPPTPLPGR